MRVDEEAGKGDPTGGRRPVAAELLDEPDDVVSSREDLGVIELQRRSRIRVALVGRVDDQSEGGGHASSLMRTRQLLGAEGEPGIGLHQAPGRNLAVEDVPPDPDAEPQAPW